MEQREETTLYHREEGTFRTDKTKNEQSGKAALVCKRIKGW